MTNNEDITGRTVRIGNGNVLWEVKRVWPDGTALLTGVTAFSRVRGQQATRIVAADKLTLVK